MSSIREEEYNKPLNLRIWAKMLPFFKPYRKEIFAIIALMLLSALIDVCFPLMQSFAVDHFILPGTVEGGCARLGIGYALMVLTQTLIVIAFSRLSMVVEMCTGRDLKRAAFVHLQTLSFSYYNTTPVGYILARVMSDTIKISSMWLGAWWMCCGRLPMWLGSLLPCCFSIFAWR